MDLSIIICTYNRSRGLCKTFQSLEEMIVPEGIDWEVLLVDNNSKDETRKVAEEFSRKGTINLRYFFEGRQGKSFALNKGLENAKLQLEIYSNSALPSYRPTSRGAASGRPSRTSKT